MSTLHFPIEVTFANRLDVLLDRIDDQERQMGQLNRSDIRRGISAPVELGVLSGPDDPDAIPNPKHFRSLYPGWLTDASPMGLGILTETELPANIKLWADLSRVAGDPLLLPLRIVYCTKVLRATYRVGAIFEFNQHDSTAA
ncbi:MAG: hypothetical protein RLN76_10465 [Phycisphaeraceae bacterium]